MEKKIFKKYSINSRGRIEKSLRYIDAFNKFKAIPPPKKVEIKKYY
jgi:hypothetical protein